MRYLQSLLLMLLLGLPAAMPAVAAPSQADAVAVATRLLDHMEAGEYEAASADFSPQMKAALGADKLAAVQQQLATAGAQTGRDAPTVSEQSGMTVVVVRIHREQASIDATIAVDGDGKVAGLHYAPAAEPAAGEDEEDGLQGSLPDLAQGDVLDQRNVEGRRHQTEPPPRYTEATLVKALEEEGIGRPSTYATIVQTVLKRDYVEKQGRQLVPQELGFIVHDLLEQYMKKYVDVPFTGEMERELDEVAQGDRKYEEVLREFWPEFKRELDSAEGAAEKQQEVTAIRCNVCNQANLSSNGDGTVGSSPARGIPSARTRCLWARTASRYTQPRPRRSPTVARRTVERWCRRAGRTGSTWTA